MTAVALQFELEEPAQRDAVLEWPTAYDPEFAAASMEQKQAALKAALEAGIAEIDAGKGIRYKTPAEFFEEIDAEFGFSRSPR